MVFVNYALTHARKIILQCIFVCAFLSAPYAVADHKLSHLVDSSASEQCELCSHTPTLTYFIDTDDFTVTFAPYNTVQYKPVTSAASTKTLYQKLGRAPPQN